MVFDHNTLITAPSEEKRTFDFDRCFAGSNAPQEGARRLDFLKKE
jgi:hypothetical protein